MIPASAVAAAAADTSFRARFESAISGSQSLRGERRIGPVVVVAAGGGEPRAYTVALSQMRDFR
jgi:hypothetical protein